MKFSFSLSGVFTMVFDNIIHQNLSSRHSRKISDISLTHIALLLLISQQFPYLNFMDMIQSTIRFLQHPFPQAERIESTYKLAVIISVFVTFFLYVFKPFGLHTLESNSFLICVGFGVVCLLVSLGYEYLVVKILKFKGGTSRFTFGRWIIYLIGLVLLISLANFLYVRLAVFGYILWEFFPHMIRGTLAVGIFPAIIMGASAMLQQERKYKKIASEFNLQKTTNQSTTTTNPTTILGIPTDQIRYVEALQNYVRITYIDHTRAIKIHTERATLKSILDDAKGSTIERSHRSFLVNRSTIQAAEGNAQGLLLTLADCEVQVPVSRSYVKVFRNS